MSDAETQTNESKDSGPTPAQGLAVMKEVWEASNRLAELQRKYHGKAIPIDKVFGALLGFGDKPDPLADVKKKLDEINAKLDRVLAGIQEIQKGLLGIGLLTVHLDIADSVFLIEKYSEALPNYLGADPSITDADRKEFVDKLLGRHSERDGVSFCAQKIIKLGPNNTPLLFDLLYPYISEGVKAEAAFDCYLRGAYAFRFVVDVLMKGMLLELFTVTAVGDPAKMDERAEKVTRKYRGWLRTMVDNSFLPFAERLATLGFLDEYMGRNDVRSDSALPLPLWKQAPKSILESADTLVARLMGRSKAVTLRVIPNAAPIAKQVPAAHPSGYVSPGRYHWEAGKTVELPGGSGKQTSITKGVVLERLERSTPPFFGLRVKGRGDLTALHVSRGDVPFMPGATVPPGFDPARLTFLRYEFDMTGFADKAQFAIILGNIQVAMSSFPMLETTWTRIYVEDGVRFPEGPRNIRNAVLDDKAGEFDLPADGQLSPVLLTYAYDMFGQRPAPK